MSERDEFVRSDEPEPDMEQRPNESDGNYDIGYGKPPVHSRFQPGQSGNSRGRPRGKKNFKTDLAEVLNASITITENGKQKVVTKQKAFLTAMVNSAIGGNMRAAAIALRYLPEVEVKLENDREHERRQQVSEAVAIANQILDKYENRLIDPHRSKEGEPQKRDISTEQSGLRTAAQ